MTVQSNTDFLYLCYIKTIIIMKILGYSSW